MAHFPFGAPPPTSGIFGTSVPISGTSGLAFGATSSAPAFGAAFGTAAFGATSSSPTLGGGTSSAASSLFPTQTPLTANTYARQLIQVPLDEYTGLKQEAAAAEARLKQEVAAAEAHASRCCAETAQARSELALMKTKMRGVLLRVAADAPTKQKLFEWLESAGVSSSEAEWMTGELRAESWQHLHTHFTMVAEQNAQLTQEVAELKAKLQSDEQQQPCTAVAETKVQSEE